MQDELKEIISKYNLVDRGMKLFENFLDDVMSDEQDQFYDLFKLYSREKMYVAVRTISYVLDNWPRINDNHIVEIISVGYESQVIGNYEIIFSADGKLESKRFAIN